METRPKKYQKEGEARRGLRLLPPPPAAPSCPHPVPDIGRVSSGASAWPCLPRVATDPFRSLSMGTPVCVLSPWAHVVPGAPPSTPQPPACPSPPIPSGASPWGHVRVRLAHGHMWLPGLPPRPALLPPPQPPSQACQEDVGRGGGGGGRGEASAWLLEKPRICSKCKQRVIFSPLPPTPGGVDTFDIGGTGWGWG